MEKGGAFELPLFFCLRFPVERHARREITDATTGKSRVAIGDLTNNSIKQTAYTYEKYVPNNAPFP